MEKLKLSILGLGSRSTLFYLKELNKRYQAQKGQYSTYPFFLLNANFEEINPLLPKPSAELDAIVHSYLSEIEKLDTEYLLIPNITLHETIDRLGSTLKILHPVQLTALKITENHWSEIVLFGSMHTMQSDYISSIFSSKGIKTIRPSAADMLLIDAVRKHVYSETETEELIENFHLLIEKYSKHRPVVLACTELSIVKPEKQIERILNMAEAQIETAVNLVLWLKQTPTAYSTY